MSTHVQIGDIRPRVQYVGDGAQTAFPYPFAVVAADDLVVFLDDAEATEGYTVDGVGESDGGTVTFIRAPVNGQRVTLLRCLTIARVSDFQDGGALRAAALNDELDHLTAVDQQLDERLSRALMVPPTVAEGVTGTLPPPRAGALIGWNTEATALVNDPLDYAELAADLARLRDGVPQAVAACARAETWARDASLSAWMVGLKQDVTEGALTTAAEAIAQANAAVGRAEAWAEAAALSAWRAALWGQQGPASATPGVTLAAMTGEGAVSSLSAVGASVPAGFPVAVRAGGATLTLDPSDGSLQVVSLTDDTVVTLPDPSAGRGYALTLKLCQDASGGRRPTIQKADATPVLWLGDAAPAWRTAPGAVDLVVVTHDGGALIAWHAGGVG